MKQISKIAILGSFLAAATFLWTGTANAADCDNAGYKKGFYIQSCNGDFKTKINVQLQPQMQAVVIEGDDNNTNTFQIRRARLTFKGHAYSKDLTYKFQMEAAGGKDTNISEGNFNGNFSLRDAWVNYKFTDYFQLKVGQAKVAFNRDELTSSSKLQFATRSLLNEVFTHGRDMGLWIHGSAYDNVLNYNFYITNDGNSRNDTNLNTEPLVGLRLDFNIMGEHGFTQGDHNDSEDHNLTFGLATNFTGRQAGNEDDGWFGLTTDLAYRYSGFSFIGALAYGMNTADDLDMWAFSAQAGYFFVPEKFQVAARWAYVAPESTITNGQEFTFGAGYYFKGHKVKLQLDYTVFLNSALYNPITGGTDNDADKLTGIHNSFDPGFNQDSTAHRVITQLQFVF